MFCAKCGKELNEGDRFCARCGKPVVMIEESETTTDSSQTANDINIINGEAPIQDVSQIDQAIARENKGNIPDDEHEDMIASLENIVKLLKGEHDDTTKHNQKPRNDRRSRKGDK